MVAMAQSGVAIWLPATHIHRHKHSPKHLHQHSYQQPRCAKRRQVSYHIIWNRFFFRRYLREGEQTGSSTRKNRRQPAPLSGWDLNPHPLPVGDNLVWSRASVASDPRSYRPPLLSLLRIKPAIIILRSTTLLKKSIIRIVKWNTSIDQYMMFYSQSTQCELSYQAKQNVAYNCCH